MALAACEAALDIEPGNSKARLQQAAASEQLGRHRLALPSYFAVLAEYPDSAKVCQPTSRPRRRLALRSTRLRRPDIQAA